MCVITEYFITNMHVITTNSHANYQDENFVPNHTSKHHYLPDPNPIVTLTSDQAAKLQKLN